MTRITLFFTAAVLALGLTVSDAEAKRLGGGTSRGMQRDSVTQQRQTAPASPTQPQQAAPQSAPQAQPASPAAQPKRNWLGPIAGLAAGLGLAALLSHFGLGEGVANFLMIALLVMAVFFVFRLLFRRKTAEHGDSGMQYAGAGAPAGGAPAPWQPSSSAPASAPTAVSSALPAGFDQDGFLRVAKVNFLRMQAAHDAGNLEDLREFTTPEMFAELRLDIDERKGAAQTTDVISVEASLIEVVTEGQRHIASVRFQGTIREEKAGPAVPFDEVWNLVKPEDGSRGWAVAGIQQMA